MMAESLAGQAFQVVISEVFPDPSPSVGLPEEEFIELTNVSGTEADISGWTVSNGRTTGRIPHSSVLLPGDVVIICTINGYNGYAKLGRAISISPFPSLTNGGDTLILSDRNGKLIHAVGYNEQQYESEKRNGGWSMEMIDLNRACSRIDNWLPSIAESGGTPGQQNSHIPQTGVEAPFQLLHAWCRDSLSVILVFNETVNVTEALNPSSFSVRPGFTVLASEASGIFFSEIKLLLDRPIERNHIYEIGPVRLSSCMGIPAGANSQVVKVALPDSVANGIVLNELMTNPPPGGSDFIEVYNKGSSIVNLQTLVLATRNNRGDITSTRPVICNNRNLFPGEYAVLTSGAGWVQRHYHTRYPETIIGLESLPSFPDKSGTVILGTGDGGILDEVNYSDSWHAPLVRVREGVSLERLDVTQPSNDSDNWHSAAIQYGYGTPGYINSQVLSASGKEDIRIIPDFFTPDGDGIDEVCEVRYRFEQPGSICSIRIYDWYGQLEKILADNALCGTSGHFSWNGKNNKGDRLSSGVYIVVTDIFQVNGKTRRYRHAITLDSR